ncbi:MAG: hypothetical protein M3P08_19220 [Thermoproteota archaeon]|nr:hypothetical protein [Thermoproteota archaeon]
MDTSEIEYVNFLQKANIRLLSFPKTELPPGEVYEGGLEKDNHIYHLGYIKEVVEPDPENTNTSLELEDKIHQQETESEFDGTVVLKANDSGKFSFLQGLLTFLKVKGSISRKTLDVADCKIKKITSLEVNPTSLESELEKFVLKERYRSNVRNLYVSTKTFFCEGFEATFNNLKSTEAEIMAEAQGLGGGQMGLSREGVGTIKLVSNQKIAFGLEPSDIDYEIQTGKIRRIRPVPVGQSVDVIGLTADYTNEAKEASYNIPFVIIKEKGATLS